MLKDEGYGFSGIVYGYFEKDTGKEIISHYHFLDMITRIIVEDSLAEFNDYATGATKRVTDERIKSTHTRLFKCILMLASSVEIEADFINNLKIGTSNFSWRRGGYDYSLNDEFREFEEKGKLIIKK